MKEYDIIVIGAGPGGLSAAKVLAAAGKKTLLLEKNPTIGPKICAGGITLKDLELGVPEDLESRQYDTLSVVAESGRQTKITMPKPFVLTITRKTLGQWMAQELRHLPIEVRTEAKVTEVRPSSVIVNGREEIGFQHLIGADGSLSIVRRHLGLPIKKALAAIQYNVPTNYPEMKFFLHGRHFGSGYAWIFPHVQFTSIGCGRLGTWPSLVSLKESFHRWLKEQGIDVGTTPLEGWTINYDYRGHEFGRLFLVGDAAGFTSGLTGEGIYFAMVSGQEIARKIIDPTYTTPELARLLVIKQFHERFLKLWERGRALRWITQELTVLLTRQRWFARKAVELFG